MSSLKKEKEKWSRCKKCELCRTRQNVVNFSGNKDAEIFIIGDSPSLKDDKKGKPFSGPSGEILENVFDECDIEQELVFLTKICCCRTRDSSKLLSGQVEKCRPRLDRLIKIVDPKIIILLGAQTLVHMTGKSKVGKEKGKILKIKSKDTTYKGIVTYDPSYYLRRGCDRKIFDTIVEHFNFALERM